MTKMFDFIPRSLIPQCCKLLPGCFPPHLFFTVLMLLKVFAQKTVEYQKLTQPAFTCSNLSIETIEQGVKYVQS